MSSIADLTSQVAALLTEFAAVKAELEALKARDAGETALQEAVDKVIADIAAARGTISSEATGPAPASEVEPEAAAHDPSGAPGT